MNAQNYNKCVVLWYENFTCHYTHSKFNNFKLKNDYWLSNKYFIICMWLGSEVVLTACCTKRPQKIEKKKQKQLNK